ncbi:MAG: radical SAM protein [Thermoproteota archaeon]
MVKKDWRKVRLRVALCFPGDYRSGMSGLTLQTLYGIFNSNEDILAERFFEGLPKSLESGRQLKEFDVIAFTLQFEEKYATVLRMLLDGGIDPKRESRRGQIVIGGGPCATANPSVLSHFFDLLVIGEIEPIFEKLCSFLFKKNKRDLEWLAGERGFFVPGFSEESERVYAQDLDSVPHIVRQIMTEECAPEQMPIFGRSFMIEACRGCPLLCRFCLSSHISSPFRYRSTNTLLKIARRGLAETGTDKVVIIGSGTSFVPGIDKVVEELVASGIRVSIPSILPKVLVRSSLAKNLASSGIRTITLAPEAGSSLRFRIGKRIEDEEFIDAASACREAGLKKMKLYFMVGLPSESERDIDDSLHISERIASKGPSKISISLNAFIPKPCTPFQWTPLLEPKVLRNRYYYLRDGFMRKGYYFSGSGVRKVPAQYVLSLGGAEVGNLLLRSIEVGENWVKAISKYSENLSLSSIDKRICASDISKALSSYREFLKEVGIH